MPAIAWLPWSADAFARARREGKPVLLSLAPSWSRYSADMDRTTYARGDVAAIVNDRFVPVRVDADRRPDIGHRYALGGWPTTAFLTPDGEILGGGTYVEGPKLAGVLQRVADAFSDGRHLAARPAAAGDTADTGGAVSLDQLVDAVFATFDARHGGFGGAPKFPHAAPIRLALDLYKDGGGDEYRQIAVESLDAIGWGPLHDEAHGGFFRYARGADWSDPDQEKLLDVNASLLGLYVSAFETLGLARYAERAEDVLRYVQTWLADPVDAGWAGSQGAEAAGSAPSRDPARDAAPPVDRTLYTDWNAAMVSAALQAGRIMDDASLSEFAIRSLERVAVLCYHPGGGMAHYFDGSAQVRGLLEDQVAMGHASLDAFEATGNVVYEMMGQELALHAIRTLWDEPRGGFFDRAPAPGSDDDVGLLHERLTPFAANCAAVRLLRRVRRTSKRAELDDYAARTLAALAPRARAEGPLAAEFVLAARDTGQ